MPSRTTASWALTLASIEWASACCRAPSRVPLGMLEIEATRSPVSCSKSSGAAKAGLGMLISDKHTHDFEC